MAEPLTNSSIAFVPTYSSNTAISQQLPPYVNYDARASAINQPILHSYFDAQSTIPVNNYDPALMQPLVYNHSWE